MPYSPQTSNVFKILKIKTKAYLVVTATGQVRDRGGSFSVYFIFIFFSSRGDFEGRGQPVEAVFFVPFGAGSDRGEEGFLSTLIFESIF